MRLIFALSVTCVLCATASALEVIPGSDVIIRSALLAPLDVESTATCWVQQYCFRPDFPKAIVPRFAGRSALYESIPQLGNAHQGGGTNVLHIKSEMGFREPVIELMISEVEPGDTGRHAVVVIAPIFPGDVTPASTSSIPAKEAVTTTRVTPVDSRRQASQPGDYRTLRLARRMACRPHTLRLLPTV